MHKDFIKDERQLERMKPHVETPLEMLSFDEKKELLKKHTRRSEKNEFKRSNEKCDRQG